MACVVIVGRDRIKHFQIKVSVRVDATWQDKLVGGIYDVCGWMIQIWGDLFDLLPLDKDVRHK